VRDTVRRQEVEIEQRSDRDTDFRANGSDR
jgi:hypothetical protein